MCEYCKNFSKRGSELELNDIFLVEPAKYTVVGDGALYRIPMNFCSNCGRELRKPCMHRKENGICGKGASSSGECRYPCSHYETVKA